jgi:hypothetical protein
MQSLERIGAVVGKIQISNLYLINTIKKNSEHTFIT